MSTNSQIPTVISRPQDAAQHLVWRHPAKEFVVGTRLIVNEWEEAIFFRNGEALDLFGPGGHELSTENLPLLKKIFSAVFGGKTPFNSEVFFLSRVTQTGLRWGTPDKVRVIEPVTKIPFEIGARGEFTLRIADSRKLLVKLIGARDVPSIDTADATAPGASGPVSILRTLIVPLAKTSLANYIRDTALNILEVDNHIADLSAGMRDRINAALDEYGLTLPEFFVSSIVTPDNDPNFQLLRQQHADQFLQVRKQQIRRDIALASQEAVAAETQAKALEKTILAKAEADAYALQAAAEAQEMRMKGYTYEAETERLTKQAMFQHGLPSGGAGGGGGGGGGILGDVVGLGVALSAVGPVSESVRGALNPAFAGMGGVGGGGGMQRPGVGVGGVPGVGVPGGGGVGGVGVGMSGVGVPQTPGFGAAGYDAATRGMGGSPMRSEPAPSPQFPPASGAPATDNSAPSASGTWDCPACPTKGITGKFCPECGGKRPAPPPPAATWDCPCGTKSLTGKFCPECGKSAPPPAPVAWDCQCGVKGLTGKFCPECGSRPPANSGTSSPPANSGTSSPPANSGTSSPPANSGMGGSPMRSEPAPSPQSETASGAPATDNSAPSARNMGEPPMPL